MIRNQLIRPYLDKFEEELNQLEKEMTHHSSGISSELLEGIYHKVQKIKETALLMPDFAAAFPAYPDALRRSKMEIRNVQRQWKRCLVNQSKMEKKRDIRHV